MKHCENCFEQNSDGATHCVICGESMSVAQMPRQDASEERVLEVTETMIEAESSSAEPISTQEPVEPVILAPEPVEEEPLPEITPSQEITEMDVAAPSPRPKKAKGKGKDKKKKETYRAEPSQVGEGMVAVLEVYHDSEPQVVHVHPIVNDITLIGREDPQRDVFPDLDLSPLESKGVSAKRASREHVRVLRRGDQFFLYVYRGTTGTQVNKEIIDESHCGKKFEIQVGDRIVLGGKVRLKLASRE